METNSQRTNVKFQCNLDRENVYGRRISVLNKLTKNPNARRNKLTNNHVSLRRREHEVNISRQGLHKTTHGKFQVDLSGLPR